MADCSAKTQPAPPSSSSSQHPTNAHSRLPPPRFKPQPESPSLAETLAQDPLLKLIPAKRRSVTSAASAAILAPLPVSAIASSSSPASDTPAPKRPKFVSGRPVSPPPQPVFIPSSCSRQLSPEREAAATPHRPSLSSTASDTLESEQLQPPTRAMQDLLDWLEEESRILEKEGKRLNAPEKWTRWATVERPWLLKQSRSMLATLHVLVLIVPLPFLILPLSFRSRLEPDKLELYKHQIACEVNQRRESYAKHMPPPHLPLMAVSRIVPPRTASPVAPSPSSLFKAAPISSSGFDGAPRLPSGRSPPAVGSSRFVEGTLAALPSSQRSSSGSARGKDVKGKGREEGSQPEVIVIEDTPPPEDRSPPSPLNSTVSPSEPALPYHRLSSSDSTRPFHSHSSSSAFFPPVVPSKKPVVASLILPQDPTLPPPRCPPPETRTSTFPARQQRPGLKHPSATSAPNSPEMPAGRDVDSSDEDEVEIVSGGGGKKLEPSLGKKGKTRLSPRQPPIVRLPPDLPEGFLESLFVVCLLRKKHLRPAASFILSARPTSPDEPAAATTTVLHLFRHRLFRTSVTAERAAARAHAVDLYLRWEEREGFVDEELRRKREEVAERVAADLKEEEEVRRRKSSQDEGKVSTEETSETLSARVGPDREAQVSVEDAPMAVAARGATCPAASSKTDQHPAPDVDRITPQMLLRPPASTSHSRRVPYSLISLAYVLHQHRPLPSTTCDRTRRSASLLDPDTPAFPFPASFEPIPVFERLVARVLPEEGYALQSEQLKVLQCLEKALDQEEQKGGPGKEVRTRREKEAKKVVMGLMQEMKVAEEAAGSEASGVLDDLLTSRQSPTPPSETSGKRLAILPSPISATGPVLPHVHSPIPARTLPAGFSSVYHFLRCRASTQTDPSKRLDPTSLVLHLFRRRLAASGWDVEGEDGDEAEALRAAVKGVEAELEQVDRLGADKDEEGKRREEEAVNVMEELSKEEEVEEEAEQESRSGDEEEEAVGTDVAADDESDDTAARIAPLDMKAIAEEGRAGTIVEERVKSAEVEVEGVLSIPLFVRLRILMSRSAESTAPDSVGAQDAPRPAKYAVSAAEAALPAQSAGTDPARQQLGPVMVVSSAPGQDFLPGKATSPVGTIAAEVPATASAPIVTSAAAPAVAEAASVSAINRFSLLYPGLSACFYAYRCGAQAGRPLDYFAIILSLFHLPLVSLGYDTNEKRVALMKQVEMHFQAEDERGGVSHTEKRERFARAKAGWEALKSQKEARGMTSLLQHGSDKRDIASGRNTKAIVAATSPAAATLNKRTCSQAALSPAPPTSSALHRPAVAGPLPPQPPVQPTSSHGRMELVVSQQYEQPAVGNPHSQPQSGLWPSFETVRAPPHTTSDTAISQPTQPPITYTASASSSRPPAPSRSRQSSGSETASSPVLQGSQRAGREETSYTPVASHQQWAARHPDSASRQPSQASYALSSRPFPTPPITPTTTYPEQFLPSSASPAVVPYSTPSSHLVLYGSGSSRLEDIKEIARQAQAAATAAQQAAAVANYHLARLASVQGHGPPGLAAASAGPPPTSAKQPASAAQGCLTMSDRRCIGPHAVPTWQTGASSRAASVASASRDVGSVSHQQLWHQQQQQQQLPDQQYQYPSDPLHQHYAYAQQPTAAVAYEPYRPVQTFHAQQTQLSAAASAAPLPGTPFTADDLQNWLTSNGLRLAPK
ncbi:hypothetical protein JCM11251_004245 [Rhodosporidiobolus azoricus]